MANANPNMEAILNVDEKLDENLTVLNGNAKMFIIGSMIKNNIVTIPAGTAGYNAYTDSFFRSTGQLEILANIAFVIIPAINATAAIIITVAYEKKSPKILLR